MRLLGLAICVVAMAAAWIPPAYAVQDDPKDETDVKQYFAARLADIDNRNKDALSGYLGLLKDNIDSSALADRVLDNAMRSGDMAAALIAARALELKNQANGTTSMLLFADAFRRRDWANAEIAAAEFGVKSGYGFAAPMLQSWINIARNKPHGFEISPANEESTLAFYSTDQRVYFELAAGNLQEARSLLATFRGVNADFARDLLIQAAPIYAANGEREFAESLIRGVADSDYLSKAAKAHKNSTGASLAPLKGVATLHTRLAGALIEQNAPDQGLIFARVALWLDPQSDAARRTLARALRALKSDDAAQLAWSSINMKSPYWPAAINEQVRYYSGIGQHETAQKLADTAFAQRRDSAYLRLLRAYAQEAGGNHQQASLIYEQLIKETQGNRSDPVQRALYLLFYATALDKSGKWGEAKLHLDQARQIDPKNPYILNYLGYGLLEHGEDLPQALAYVKQAHALSPDSAAITDSLGWGYYVTGDYTRAVLYLERAVQKSGDDPAINEHMGDAYWQAGRRVDARYAWQTAKLLTDGANAERLAQKLDIGLAKNSALNKIAPIISQNP